MRNPARIIPILQFFTNNLTALEEFCEYHVDITIFNHDLPKITKYWLDNPDQRFGQMLINLNIVPDGKYWNTEEVDWLIEKQHFSWDELHFWGRNYTKDNVKLDKTEWIRLKDLENDHIKKIMGLTKALPQRYYSYFKLRLK